MMTTVPPRPTPGSQQAASPTGLWPGSLTAEEIRALIDRRDPLILEVGANSGQTTAELLRAMPRARIHAFEPDPRAIAKFRRNIRHPWVYLYECAVGARVGTVTFHQSAGAEELPDYGAGWDQSGSIRRPREHLEANPWVRFDRQIEVPITTLDAWAADRDIGEVDFIWADVQGAESDLVQGAARVLATTRYLFTEYSDREMYEGQATLDQLTKALPGFALLRRYEWDALFRNTRLA